jgi:hypothetical protein
LVRLAEGRVITFLLVVIVVLLVMILTRPPSDHNIIQRINQLETKMAGELDRLEAEVAENSSAIDSAITLLKGLKDALDAAIASGNMSRVSAVADALDAKTAALAQAVVANTPANPTP